MIKKVEGPALTKVMRKTQREAKASTSDGPRRKCSTIKQNPEKLQEVKCEEKNSQKILFN